MSMRGGILFFFFFWPRYPSYHTFYLFPRFYWKGYILWINLLYWRSIHPRANTPFFLSHATYSYDWLPILSYLIWIKYDGVNNLLLGDVIAHCNCVCRRLSPRCYLRIKCTHTDTSSFVFCKLASTSLDNNTIVPINSSLDATLWWLHIAIVYTVIMARASNDLFYMCCPTALSRPIALILAHNIIPAQSWSVHHTIINKRTHKFDILFCNK